MKAKGFILYKIYYPSGLAYLGRTQQNLQQRLRGHFFKAKFHKSIDIFQACKFEYAEFKTKADMFLYEIYYINKLKPPLNRDDKADDELTINLPDVEWKPFECNLQEKWMVLYQKLKEEDALRKRIRKERSELKNRMRKTLSKEEYDEWLLNSVTNP